MGCEKEDMEAKVNLCEIDTVIGRAHGGRDAGRLPHIKYEEIGEKIDLRHFWRQGDEPGLNVFNWGAFACSKYKWLVNRPDVCVFFWLFFTHYLT